MQIDVMGVQGNARKAGIVRMQHVDEDEGGW